MIYWNLQISFQPDSMRGATSKSFKVKAFLKKLENNFKKYYVPDKFISIDECTIGFKGRVAFRVYNKDKPIKWGIKIYALAHASNSYVFSIEPYFGQSPTNSLACSELPVTSRVVVHLANNLKELPNDGEGYHIFVDRYYSSLVLADKLKEMKLYVTGTVMTNRKNLPSAVNLRGK